MVQVNRVYLKILVINRPQFLVDSNGMCNNFKNGLPMHRTTTSTKNENDVKMTVKGPKKATMEFIKQFARAYQFNVELPRGLESMILN